MIDVQSVTFDHDNLYINYYDDSKTDVKKTVTKEDFEKWLLKKNKLNVIDTALNKEMEYASDTVIPITLEIYLRDFLCEEDVVEYLVANK